MQPKVSIIVPCYNVKNYLDRCLNSIVKQTLNDIEIILVDDKSSDSTPIMCDNWAKQDIRIKVCHKTVNEGLGLARNTGLENASGEYVAFIDSDDWIEDNMMEKLYEECKKENLDVIYTEFNVDEYPGFHIVLNPEKLYKGYKQIENLRLDIIGSEPQYISGVKFHCSACKALYKKNIIDNFKLRFRSEREYISEDMVFNIDFLLKSSRVKTAPWQFYHYCLNNQSLSHTYRADRWEKQLKMIDVLDSPSIYEDSNELHLRLARTAIFYTMSAIGNELSRNDIKRNKKIKNINIITTNKKLQSLISDYPILQLPWKWKIYTLALKFRLNNLLYYLVSQ